MKPRWYAVHRKRLRLVRRLDIYGIRITLRAGAVCAASILIAGIAAASGVPLSTALYVPVVGTLGYVFMFDTPLRGRTMWQIVSLAAQFWTRPRRFRRPFR